ncbi:MAG TPA: GntR family transcriptional regulator [Sphaerochaeta sp.]|nr:MAG: GntR family transcriptional regulator [Spirochaetes bacterium GWC2_52_13]OHD62046.1 MAG: GntR family transcriptional regulator [Spirochaetes bacterium GWF2_52_7]PKL22570.1 MAG: GntR family transcriptional regulator [Spirochaetae bacterium HGW-Spirochaetae-4]HCG63911.1 GntR family transcriptional regulator [Sphaerochaeta sp.]HCJ93669.1 GntR family transcriptional regulator [Sphaerochaeta sp.]
MTKDADQIPITFTLDSKSGIPYYKQIILQVEMAIADGRLSKGARLPTVRSLAVDLSINPNTVARAYNEMEIRDIVVTQQGSGTFISEKQITIDAIERERILTEITRSFITKAASYGFTLEELLDHIRDLGSDIAPKGDLS